MKIETRRLTTAEIQDILAEGPDITSKGDKLRLLAVSVQRIILPIVGKEDAESNIIADLMNWADEADFADHAMTCKDCATNLIDEARTLGILAENQPVQ